MDAPICDPNRDDVAGGPILHATNCLVKARRVPSARPVVVVLQDEIHGVCLAVEQAEQTHLKHDALVAVPGVTVLVCPLPFSPHLTQPQTHTKHTRFQGVANFRLGWCCRLAGRGSAKGAQPGLQPPCGLADPPPLTACVSSSSYYVCMYPPPLTTCVCILLLLLRVYPPPLTTCVCILLLLLRVYG